MCVWEFFWGKQEAQGVENNPVMGEGDFKMLSSFPTPSAVLGTVQKFS